MNLSTGTRLGHYEIVAPIGAGGMGEVFKARDTRLDRSVAIKVLATGVAGDSQLRQRLEREARTISQLNHPNICTLYDVGHENGTDYLVMELIDGESLADRLSRGPLPLDQVLRYGVQIADALARAHRQGIVHRDLKPGNIMITKTGAKLLDFGLAKDVGASGPTAVSVLQTEKKPITQEGTILGTVQYMAPEQLEGIEADARTDIFALGAVVYEMATGKRAFEGKTRTSLIAAIVSSEPTPISQVQPLTPPALEHVVRKCLAKDPEDRWQSAHDIAAELRWISEAGSSAGMPAPLVSRRRTRERLLWIAALLAATSAAAYAAWRMNRREETPAPIFRADLTLQPAVSAGSASRPFELSPDGKWLAYVAPTDAALGLYLRRLDQPSTTAVPDTRGATTPIFSPDSRFVAFHVGNRWRSVPVGGGSARQIASCDCWTPSWASTGHILFASERGIDRVSERGGALETIVPRVEGYGFADPFLMPDGKSVLLTLETLSADQETEVGLYDMESKKLTKIGPGGNARFVNDRIVYMNGDALVAARFDPKQRRVLSNPVTLSDPVAKHPVTRDAFFSVSNAGLVAFMSADTTFTNARLVWVDRNGRVDPINVRPQPYAHPRISPDGRSILFAIRGKTTDAWSLDLERMTVSRLTFVPIENEMPLWMPDGRRIIYSSTRANEARAHYVLAADGTGEETQVLSSKVHQHLSSVSPDGKSVLLTEFNPGAGMDVLELSPEGKRVKPFLNTRFDEFNAQFSPDGKWIAYTSNESGRHEVYVIGRAGGKWQVSTEGGLNPVWSRNGRELFYRSGKKLFAVAVAPGGSFSASLPRLLFEGQFEALPREDTNYDVSPDGRRFLMIQTDTAAADRPLTVVVNWAAGLEQ